MTFHSLRRHRHEVSSRGTWRWNLSRRGMYLVVIDACDGFRTRGNTHYVQSQHGIVPNIYFAEFVCAAYHTNMASHREGLGVGSPLGFRIGFRNLPASAPGDSACVLLLHTTPSRHPIEISPSVLVFCGWFLVGSPFGCHFLGWSGSVSGSKTSPGCFQWTAGCDREALCCAPGEC